MNERDNDVHFAFWKANRSLGAPPVLSGPALPGNSQTVALTKKGSLLALGLASVYPRPDNGSPTFLVHLISSRPGELLILP